MSLFVGNHGREPAIHCCPKQSGPCWPASLDHYQVCKVQGYLCLRPEFCHVVCLPVTSRQTDGTKTQIESIYVAFMLAVYRFWQLMICATKLYFKFVV